MDKLLSELENSEVLLERQEYAMRLKKYIAMLEKSVVDMGEIVSEKAISNGKKAIKEWKIKLSNYDVYKQKIKCQFCKEEKCHCYVSQNDTATSNQDLSEVLRERAEQ